MLLLAYYDKFGNEKVQNSTVEKIYSMRVTITRTWRTQLKSDDSAAVSPLELFVRYSGDLQKPTALPTVLAMMGKARACGYDGMLYECLLLACSFLQDLFDVRQVQVLGERFLSFG